MGYPEMLHSAAFPCSASTARASVASAGKPRLQICRALPLLFAGKIDLDQSVNRTIRMSAELLLIPHYEVKIVSQDR